MNINCVICSDTFISSDNVFTTPCGHIFHHVCLIQWLERKKDCPQCRTKCNERSIVRIYFNNINLDTSQVDPANSARLIESIDNLTFQVREKDLKLKKIEQEKNDLQEKLTKKEKQIKKLDALTAQNNQVIATMKHEIDLLSTTRASYRNIESENSELKMKIGHLEGVQAILEASQKEVDEVLKQNLNAKDLSVMVGTLKRELHANDIKKNDLRKQLQFVKNDLRIEQEKSKEIREKLSALESENHTLKNRLRKVEERIEEEPMEVGDSQMDVAETPEPAKKARIVLSMLDDQNTPSPLSRSTFDSRVKQVQESTSPYLKVKSSSVGLALLKKPTLHHKSSSSSSLKSLSIFQKPRVLSDGTAKKPEMSVFNGIGGTSKVLPSDLIVKPLAVPKKTFKKNLSASALGK